MISLGIILMGTWMMGEFMCYWIFTGTYPNADTYTVMNSMLVFQQLLSGNVFGAISQTGDFAQGVVALFMWDWPMFDQAGYDLFRFFVLYPLSFGFLIGFILMFVGTIGRLFTR